jgi:hypothetical protein
LTALILRAMPLVEIVVPKLRTIYQGFLHALDAFAEATMCNAVRPREARRRDQSLSPHGEGRASIGAIKLSTERRTRPSHRVKERLR